MPIETVIAGGHWRASAPYDCLQSNASNVSSSAPWPHTENPPTFLFASAIRRRWSGKDATSAWNPAGSPGELPSVCRRSALLAQPTLNHRHREGPRSFRSPWNPMFFHRHFRKSSQQGKSCSSSPVFRLRVRTTGRSLAGNQRPRKNCRPDATDHLVSGKVQIINQKSTTSRATRGSISVSPRRRPKIDYAAQID